jgi:hypothetical protein
VSKGAIEGTLVDQLCLVLGSIGLVGVAALLVRWRWRPGKTVDRA